MTTVPITRKSVPRKPPAKRLFSGMAGSPLSKIIEPTAKPAQSPSAAVPVMPETPAVETSPLPKKRGRPPKHAVAMTCAQRQVRSRANRKAKHDDAEHRNLIARLVKIYDRQATDVVVFGRDRDAVKRAEDRRAIDRKQKRLYLEQLKALSLEELQLALEGKQTPDTHGRLPGERSGEGARAMGQSEIERLIAVKQHDSSLFEDEDQDPNMAEGFKVTPKGAGADSFDAKESTADTADKPTTRQRIPTMVLERQKTTNEKMLALVHEVFDETGCCHIEELCMYDRTPCSFRATNTDEAVEHLWAEYYKGERLWDHVRKLSDPAIAETIEAILIEARKNAWANIHHWVITQWIARYRNTRRTPDFVTHGFDGDKSCPVN
jgi:hypothetical protein